MFQEIKDADELYVFGPADMKLKLKQKIVNDTKFTTKLKKVEAADGMTNNQVVAKVKEFFTK